MKKTFGPSTIATGGGLATIGSVKYPQSIFNFTGIWGDTPSTVPDFELGPPYESDEVEAVGKAEENFLKTGGLKAMQCFLYWCVQALQVDVINGQVEETTIDAWYNETTLPPDVVYGDDLYGDGFVSFILADKVWALQPPRLGSNGSSSNFTVARYASQALSDWLVAHLTITTSRTWDDVAADPSTTGLSQHEFEKQRLLLSTNVTKMFENLAATMTHYLRSTSLEDEISSHGPWSSKTQGRSSNSGPTRLAVPL